MVGQTQLLNKLNKYTIDTYPHSSIFLGERGSGKHLIVNYLKDNILKLPLVDITGNISDEYIKRIYINPNPSIYLIDTSHMMEKEQNILLKFLEEPLKTAFVILLCENKVNLLDTIKNRAVLFEMDLYTKEELSSFVSSKENVDLITSIIRTPGKIINTNDSNIKDMYDVCLKIVDKIEIANFSNTLTIVNKINYKDQFDKFDIFIFLDMLAYLLFQNYLKTNNKIKYDMYKLTVDSKKCLIDDRINKELFMYNFLTKLWKESRKKI